MKRKIKNVPKNKNFPGFNLFATTVLFLAFYLCSAFLVYADSNVTGAFTSLRLAKGARPAAMGDAFTAIADDINAIYWNPAGLAIIKQKEISASYLSYVVDINSGYFGYATPTRGGGLGIGIVYLDYGKIEKSTEDDPTGENSGYYRPNDMEVIASYGSKLNENLHFGINAKGIHENINGYTATAFAFDLGTLYKLPGKNISLSFTAKNLGKQTKAFIEEKNDLPLLFDVGISYRPFNQTLKLGLDLYKPKDGDFNVNLGGEYNWKNIISLRMGYRSIAEDLKTGSNKDGLTGFCAGLGLNMNSYTLDYAFVPFNELGNTHRVSLGMKWGNSEIKREKSHSTSNSKIAGIKHYKKANKYSTEGHYKKALAEYGKAIKDDYKTAQVYANMGYCYHKLGMKIAAKRYYNKALKLNPKNKTIQKNLRLLSKNDF